LKLMLVKNSVGKPANHRSFEAYSDAALT